MAEPAPALAGKFGTPQKVEWLLIAVADGVVVWCMDRLPHTIELGSLLTIAALALLLQGFFRDLWILRRQRKHPGGPVEHASCMCVESTLGLTGIFAGMIIAAFGVKVPVLLAPWMWPALVLAVWAAGFSMRDFVLQWKPWAIRRVANHGSLIVRWR